MATIESRSNSDGTISHHVKIRLKGYLPQNASFARKTDAKRWAQNTEAAIREGRYFKTSPAKLYTLADAIDRYVKEVMPYKLGSHAQYFQLEWWKVELGYLCLADLTPALIGEYRNKLTNKPITPKQKYNAKQLPPKKRSPSTVIRYLAALSHVLSVAVLEWQWLLENPVSKVKKPKEPRGRVRFLSDTERETLLDFCRKSEHLFLYTIVVLAISTGMRRGEIMSLRWSQVDLKLQKITLHKTKNGDRRSIPIVSHAYEQLLKLNKLRLISSDLLFPGKSGIRPLEINRPWYTALSKANIEDFRFHDLRHCTASYLAMNGATLIEIAAVLGHKTLNMVKRYAHISQPHTHRVVSEMNEKIFLNIAS